MQLSKTEESLLLQYHLDNGAEDFVVAEIEKYKLNIPAEEVLGRLYQLVFSNLDQKERDDFIKARDVLSQLFIRRKYDVWSFFATEETVKRQYPDGTPEIVNIDNDILPPKTLQLGLYLLYITTEIKKPKSEEWEKMDDEEKEMYERTKDWHDWLNGYLNQETIKKPEFILDDLFDEIEKKRQITRNHIENLFRGFGT